MSISYFDCDTCGVEMNDCACELSWTMCASCEVIYCEDCAVGIWVRCKCSGFAYCESCVSGGEVCGCGSFGDPFRPAKS